MRYFKPEVVKVSGFVEANQIRLGSQVGGWVIKILVKEGDEVRRNAPLVEFDPYNLLEQKAQAQALLEQRQAEYDRFVAGLRTEDVEQTRFRYERMKTQYEKLQAGPRQQEIDVAVACSALCCRAVSAVLTRVSRGALQ